MRLVGGPQQPLLRELRQAADRHSDGRLQFAAAWVNDEGAALILESTAKILRREAIVGINNQGTTLEGLLRLLDGTERLHVLYQHPAMTFHPKAYCFDDASLGTLIVGSSNLTVGGLDTNFEASVVLDLTPPLRDQWTAFWGSLENHAFAMTMGSASDIERLYKGGYVVLEATTRSRRRRLLRRSRRVLEGEQEESFDLPTAPPRRRFRSASSPIDIPFEVVEEPTEPPVEEEEPEPATGVAPAHRVFVRTLTPNDVAKLHGEQTGTFEPDLGLAARDDDQSFWGWPDAYQLVVRQLPRHERSELVRLVSRITGPKGTPVDLVIWFREGRPGHPAEFRVSPRPISGVRAAVPDDFDDASVLVIEKTADSFVLRLLTARDPEYDAYVAIASVVRPAHRYGYGNRP
jgi:hypothetical protein